MTIPTSGTVSFANLRDEYGDTNPVSINEFYRGGGLVPDSLPNNGPVPTGGNISLEDMRGSSDEFVAVVDGIFPNGLDVDSLFTPTAWASDTPKRVIINSGAVIGNVNNSLPALEVGGGLGSTLTIINNGRIYGAPGPSNNGRGGDAVVLLSATSIENLGFIYAGGGGGVRGSNGGSGQCPRPCNQNCNYGVCGGAPGNVCRGCPPNATVGPPNCSAVCLGNCSSPGSTPAGGQGGAGGTGQGFANSPPDYFSGPNPGSPGGSGGGCGAGNGSPGSSGFAWGEGNGGDAVVNSGLLTFIGPPGNILGDLN